MISIPKILHTIHFHWALPFSYLEPVIFRGDYLAESAEKNWTKVKEDLLKNEGMNFIGGWISVIPDPDILE